MSMELQMAVNKNTKVLMGINKFDRDAVNVVRGCAGRSRIEAVTGAESKALALGCVHFQPP